MCVNMRQTASPFVASRGKVQESLDGALSLVVRDGGRAAEGETEVRGNRQRALRPAGCVSTAALLLLAGGGRGGWCFGPLLGPAGLLGRAYAGAPLGGHLAAATLPAGGRWRAIAGLLAACAAEFWERTMDCRRFCGKLGEALLRTGYCPFPDFCTYSWHSINSRLSDKH